MRAKYFFFIILPGYSEMIRFIFCHNFISPPFLVDTILLTLTFRFYLAFVYPWQI